MNEADRKKRDKRIEAFFLKGTAPTDIAKYVGLKVERVRKILKDRGHEMPVQVARDASHFWEMSDSRRREAVWRRQRDGARQALGMFSPSINSSHG